MDFAICCVGHRNTFRLSAGVLLAGLSATMAQVAPPWNLCPAATFFGRARSPQAQSESAATPTLPPARFGAHRSRVPDARL